MRDEIGKLLVFSGALAVVMAAVVLRSARASAGAQATKRGASPFSSGRPDLQDSELWT